MIEEEMYEYQRNVLRSLSIPEDLMLPDKSTTSSATYGQSKLHEAWKAYFIKQMLENQANYMREKYALNFILPEDIMPVQLAKTLGCESIEPESLTEADIRGRRILDL